MKCGLNLLMAGAVLWAAASTGVAQDANTAKTSETAKTEAKSDAPSPARLRARMHRTMAALIEARNAEEPDSAKIEKLTDQLQTLRNQIRAQGPVRPRGGPAAWQCPRGGPQRGYGYGRGGPGRGYGRGAPGRGYGRGSGWGCGAGYGPGPAWSAGRGPGVGRGRAFVDKDRDGVCDNFEKIRDEQK